MRVRRWCGSVLLALLLASPAQAQAAGWHLISMPDQAQSWSADGVAAFGPHRAYVVGQDETGAAMVARYDGNGWHEAYQGPASSVFRAIAKLRGHRAWVVGFTTTEAGGAQAIISHYDDGWQASPAANRPVFANNLYGVAAVSDHNVWAVGSSSNDFYATTHTLAEHWDGDHWRIVRSPTPDPAGANELTSADAASDGAVFAAGYSDTTPLLLRRGRLRWHRLPLPALPGFDDAISAVAARSASDAWFVGTFQRTSDGLSRPLVLHWNGSTLRRLRAQQPSPWDESFLSAVTITRRGGVYAAGTALYSAFDASQATVWRLTGRRFVPVRTPQVGGSGMTAIDAGRGLIVAAGSAEFGGAFTERLIS
jgi:hypothetical protein